MMTKKNYEAIAQSIRFAFNYRIALQTLTPDEAYYFALRSLVDDLAEIFEDDNARFDRVRFLEACGIYQDLPNP